MMHKKYKSVTFNVAMIILDSSDEVENKILFLKGTAFKEL